MKYFFNKEEKGIKLYGFSNFEKKGCWTLGCEAKIIISKDRLPPKATCIKIAFSPYFPNNYFESSFDIYLRGFRSHFFSKKSYQGSGFFVLDLPVLFKNEDIEVIVNLHKPISPKEFGKSEDARKLGLFFKSLEVVGETRGCVKNYLNNSYRVEKYFPDFKSCLVEMSHEALSSRSSSQDFKHDSIINYKYKIFCDLDINNSYREDMDDFIKANNAFDDIFPVSFGDGHLNKGDFSFVKTKVINCQNSFSVILKLNAKRHWEILKRMKRDITWDEKCSDIIWRGATTGIKNHGKRLRFVKSYKENYNVGFSHVSNHASADLEKHVVGRVSVADQLDYKYIVSIEGNDVATNLKWILASNSVPVMPKQTRESWLLESQLLPYVHYVPLNDDLGNLDEIYDWCLNNDDHCRQIAENGKRYMEMFFDVENEKEIYRMIYKKYKECLESK